MCEKTVESYMLRTPIGVMMMEMCPQGMHRLSQLECVSDATFDPKSPEEFDVVPPETLSENKNINRNIEKCIKWLRLYFMDVKKTADESLPDLCIASEACSFNEKVWIALAKNVGPGKIISYGELAKLVNSPGASQAVGNAMAANPFQILVPCHRVIRSDGCMGLYSRGKKNSVKKWLLEHEGLKIANNKIITNG